MRRARGLRESARRPKGAGEGGEEEWEKGSVGEAQIGDE